ncbi:hypothetical protein HCJ52_13985 [Listeria sp. FSL L7-1485]|uniref:Uncharacterized protein n=1 Tax=Listeria ivanovii TaxID=1638 RepID=A0A7T0Q8J3_LISIV|nr:hypothetical protein [Listeria immobilis]MBC1508283.1 hypothetical protein [Listeria immobilis]MBC1537223.1 hypothetical protein [Listeria immobilis]QPL19485.1 hypothetical protein pLIS600251c [Listeria ivanovii]UCK61616.1 type IV secretion system/conjugative transfer family protein [Listeria ivanovii]
MRSNKKKWTPKEKSVLACGLIFILCVGVYVYKTYIYSAPEPVDSSSPLVIEKKHNQTTTTNETEEEATLTTEDKQQNTAEQVFAKFLENYPTFDANKPTEHVEKVQDMLDPGFYQTLLTEQENMTTVPQYQTTIVESINNMSDKSAENDAVYWKAEVTTVNQDKEGKPLSTIKTQYVATLKQVDGKWVIIDLMQEGKGARLHE